MSAERTLRATSARLLAVLIVAFALLAGIVGAALVSADPAQSGDSSISVAAKRKGRSWT